MAASTAVAMSGFMVVFIAVLMAVFMAGFMVVFIAVLMAVFMAVFMDGLTVASCVSHAEHPVSAGMFSIALT
ncbi:hypothetical protein Barb4_05102 [Bacteroidales bacterium Barb4]|nr:hypothetical protein Barb4_05102 [Bacteroidales bacterium Barb4]